MKKKHIINLIKYHVENNDFQFRNEAVEIAKIFEKMGDYQLSEYIMGLLSTADTLVPQGSFYNSDFLKEIDVYSEMLQLPESLAEDIMGIINAVNHRVGVNKFLFKGSPGTGKTETVKQVARLLERQLYMVEFSEVINSKLGQTQKNIVALFKEINSVPYPSKVLILLDELDAIALDRINVNDIREMGRATSAILKELDQFNEEIVLIATTNLYDDLDPAITRRFDSVIDFNQYDKEDLIEIAVSILNSLLKTFQNAKSDKRLFKKILNSMDKVPYPGELKNLIKVSLAFSDPKDEYDYFRKLAKSVFGDSMNYKELSESGFTLREIEILTGISKSQVARLLKEEAHE